MGGLFGAIKKVVRAFIDPEYRKKHEPSKEELFDQMWQYLEFDNTTNLMTLVSTLVGTTTLDIDHLSLLWKNVKGFVNSEKRAQAISVGMSLLTIDRFIFPKYINKEVLDEIVTVIREAKDLTDTHCYYASVFDTCEETKYFCPNKEARNKAVREINASKYPWLSFTYQPNFIMDKPPLYTSDKELELPNVIYDALENFDFYRNNPLKISTLLLQIKESSAMDVFPHKIEERFSKILDKKELKGDEALYAAEITSVANVVFCKIQHLIYMDSLYRLAKFSGVH